jgi:diguanylate cyclase (GGDEF)-like protein/PAS domain S-box-containing protein
VDHLSQGLTIFDDELRLVLFNRALLTLLDFPPDLVRVGMHISELFYYNAERGEYGPGDVEEQVRNRVETAARFTPHGFLRERADGTVLEIRGDPLPGGGFITVYADVTDREQAVRARAQSEARLRDYAASSSDWFWESDAGHRLTALTGRRSPEIKVSARQLLGEALEALVDPLGRDPEGRSLADLLNARAAIRDLEFESRDTEGQMRWFRLNGIPVQADDGRFSGYRGTGSDITGVKRAELELRKLVLAVEQSPTAVLMTDLDGNIDYANPACLALTGYPEAELVGGNLSLIASGEEEPAALEAFWRTIRAGHVWRGEFRSRRKSGELFWDETTVAPVKDAGGEVLLYIVLKQDVTEQKRLREQTEHLAYHDLLTGLPNRAQFEDRLGQAAELCARQQLAATVLYMDLDGFKEVNDRLGHQAGDALLREVARRMRGCLRAFDLLARVGGDEFVALLIHDSGGERDRPATAARRIIASLEQPVALDAGAAVVGVSIGVASCARGGGGLSSCLRRADAAMYRAKRSGKGRFAYSEAE